MKKISILFLCLLMIALLTACSGYPRLLYEENWMGSGLTSRLYILEQNSKLDPYHPCDKTETDTGYDITFHFVSDQHEE